MASFNPFRGIANFIKNTVSGVQSVFRPENEIEYFERTGEWGINTHPRWSIGSQDNPASIKDFDKLWADVRDKRFQSSYTIVVCGHLEDPYPNHDPDEPVTCLSYRRDAYVIDAARRETRTLEEMVQYLASPDAKEQWVDVTEIQFIDKE